MDRLEALTNYSIEVAAVTIGVGVYSDAVFIKTNENENGIYVLFVNYITCLVTSG